MKPSILAALVIRLVSMGFIGYGTYLLIAGFVSLRAISKQVAAFEAAGGDASVGILNNAMRGILISSYGGGGAAVVIGIILLLTSRSLGNLIARGLE